MRQPEKITLTPREKQVAELAAIGLTNKAIGEKLTIEPQTVKSHLQRVYKKTGATSRAELAAISQGLIVIKTQARIVEMLGNLRADRAKAETRRNTANYFRQQGELFILDHLLRTLEPLDPARTPGPPMTEDERERQARIRAFTQSNQEDQ